MTQGDVKSSFSKTEIWMIKQAYFEGGWCIYTNAKYPRGNMESRFCKSDGKYGWMRVNLLLQIHINIPNECRFMCLTNNGLQALTMCSTYAHAYKE